MARILIVGAGSLACSVVPLVQEYELAIVDGDKIEEGNLVRQPLYKEEDIAKWKVEVMKRSFPAMEIHKVFLDQGNAEALVANADVVLDLADDLHLTQVLDNICGTLGKPLLVASVHRDQAQVYLLHHDGRHSFKEVFTGRIGPEQDGCDMQNVSLETIEATGERTRFRLQELLTGKTNTALDLYHEGAWQCFELASPNI